MEYVYGALVLHAAGKPVNEENLKKVLTAAGVKVDETRVKALTAALEGVNIDEALKAAGLLEEGVIRFDRVRRDVIRDTRLHRRVDEEFLPIGPCDHLLEGPV